MRNDSKKKSVEKSGTASIHDASPTKPADKAVDTKPTGSQSPPPDPKAKPPLSPKSAVPIAVISAQSRIIEERMISASLHAIIDGPQIGLHQDGALLSLVHLTEKAADPVERMLLEQFMLGHHRLAQLHVKCSETRDIEHIKVNNAAAARLQAELRRLALAIKSYREPVAPKSFAVVHQQNVVSSGQQHVRFVSENGNQKMQVHDEVKSSDPLKERMDAKFPTSGAGLEEPAACVGGQGQRLEARSVDA